MEEALSFFRTFEVWIYVLLGFGGLIYLRKFILAWQELRGAAFGLERENAQTRLNQSASLLVLILMITVAEFVLVSFIAPAVPGAMPLPSPTLNVLATPTTTLSANPLGGMAATEAPPLEDSLTSLTQGCIPGQIEIISPQTGQEVSGVVVITGTAKIPDFGYYQFETRTVGATDWEIVQAGNVALVNGKLGDWNTTRLVPGEYQFALIVVDSQAKKYPPCIVQLRVALPPESTRSP